MGLRIVMVCMVLVFLITLFPAVESKGIKPYYQMDDHYFHGSIWLYPYIDTETHEPALMFAPNMHHLYYDGSDYFDPWEGIYDEWGDPVELKANESITFNVSIPYRTYNPEIDWEFNLDTTTDPGEVSLSGLNVTYELRFDSNGDSEHDYIVSVKEVPGNYWVSHPTVIYGEPEDIVAGSVELVVTRSDFLPQTYLLYGSPFNTNIQIPFDLDTDMDGLGDYSDSDDDNDGHSDISDWFPQDPDEWKDTDGDGIGDNSDSDANGNQIPDDLELPLALCIMLIPAVVIVILMKRIRKGSGLKNAEEKEGSKITNSKSGPKNW